VEREEVFRAGGGRGVGIGVSIMEREGGRYLGKVNSGCERGREGRWWLKDGRWSSGGCDGGRK
jgi:hypothetical protein